MASYSISVNGSSYTVEAQPGMPLLWVLRDLLHMTGTKFGCGVSSCGACTVLVNDQAVRSCQLPVQNCIHTNITTIEGLSPQGDHPVQRAWQEVNVPQCGYCQAGQMLSAWALLKKYPAPTDAQISEAMAGNLCRCGTYQRIRKAIHLAAADMNQPKPIES